MNANINKCKAFASTPRLMGDGCAQGTEDRYFWAACAVCSRRCRQFDDFVGTPGSLFEFSAGQTRATEFDASSGEVA